MPAPRVRRALSLLFTSILAASTLVATATTPAAATGGSSFVAMANGYRVDANLGPVSLHAGIDQIATERGRQLAAAGTIGHDFEYLKQRFADLGICWRAFGEIVAYNGNGDYAYFGNQWYNSDPHRAIMLGDYTHAGGSREYANGRWYGVMVFVKLCGASTAPPPIAGFTDIGTSPFVDDIVWLVDQGITTGCAETLFCPRQAVAREQMASFLSRAEGLPSTSVDYFTDDAASFHQDNINRIAAAGVTTGCATARYCPGGTVTREQMAAFLARALALPATSRDYFTDDEDSPHEDAINRLAAAGVSTGCTATTYCPLSVVTREQMAAFIHRGFN